MVKILECRKLECRIVGSSSSKSTLNFISQIQFSIDHPELWHSTSFWSSETKYGIQKFIRPIFFCELKKIILARFRDIFY